MATTENSGGVRAWDSAKQFAVDRLKEETESLSPSALAEEYGCSGDHMRHCLADLAKEELVERIGHGEYTAGEQAGEQVLQHEDHTDSRDEDSPEDTEDTGNIGPSVDGPARSEDPDTTGGSPVEIEEDERAEVELSESDEEDGDGERVDVDRDGDGGRSVGVYIIAGTVLLVLAALWLSIQDQSDETPEQPGQDEEEEEAVDPDVWGAE
nr:hypothetical protein [Haloarcula sp. AS7094]